MRAASFQRRCPVGAEPAGDDQVSVRLWAPDHRRVSVVMDGTETDLEPEPDGYFTGLARGRPGSRYGFRIDADPRLLADPASRFQPDGPDGLSEVVDPGAYEWTDSEWPGLDRTGQVLYELHIGTFTQEGTWRAAQERLPELAALGVTALLVMPVAEFAGAFGWGYDGVGWFSPTRLYGRPDDFRRFVDGAHAAGLGIVLDVVYNHVGPRGNVLAPMTKAYFSERYSNEWGEAMNFDGASASPVRAHVVASAVMWVREYHVDGFRLDATQQMFDRSPEHIVAALTRAVREAAHPRRLFMLGENEPQVGRFFRPAPQGGYDLDALYNDDFQRAARVRLTGVREAYYSDYTGSAAELLAAARWGFLFQGQTSSWQDQRRGTPVLDRSPSQFLCFLENHDQVANSTRGQRLVEMSSPGELRALTALLLLMPSTPLLFQGQEYGSTTPFTYFAAHEPPLAAEVRKGRTQFLSQFTRIDPGHVPNPAAPSTFERCKRDLDGEASRGRHWWELHRDLIDRRHALLSDTLVHVDGATISPDLLLLRYFDPGRGDSLLVVNLDGDFDLARASEPLVAPPAAHSWTCDWSSEDVAYGGGGTPTIEAGKWIAPGHAAVLLHAVAASRTREVPET